MGFVVVRGGELHRVRGHHGQLQARGQLHGGGHVRLVVAAAGALQLQVEAVRKQLGQLERRIARLLRLPLQQRLPDRPRLRTRQQDQPVGQLGQPGPAHHRLRLDHALRPRAGQQLGQVQVALVVDHQQQHAAGRVLLRVAPLQQHLGTDQRLDAGAARGLVELDGAKQVAEIGDGQCRLPVARCCRHHVVHARGAVDD